MKNFLALITCLIMLSIGTVQATESKGIERPEIAQSCIDVGTVSQLQVIQFNQVPDFEPIVCIDYRIPDTGQTVANIGKPDEQGIYKQMLQKQALNAKYRLIPDCTMEFIGKIKTKYITHYSYNFINTYSHPPLRNN
jgi:hypothetical protein